MSTPSPSSDSRRRMRSVLRRIHENEGSPPSELALPPASPSATTMAPPARRRAQPSERFQRLNDQRARRSQSMHDRTYEGLVELQEASERLAQTNANVHSLLDRRFGSRPASSNRQRSSRFLEADEQTQTAESQPRRKRRRVDDRSPSLQDSLRPVQSKIKSTSLPMEIRHANTSDVCPQYDISDQWRDLGDPPVRHILRDDPSIYFTRSRRANIVLQHPDERLFTLNRIVITTPEGSDNNLPLQGLVFSSLDASKKFERTTHYQIHHFATSRFGPHSTHGVSALREQSRGNIGEAPSPSHEATSQNVDPITNQDQLRVSAECEGDLVDSESDESDDTRRPQNVVVPRDHDQSLIISDPSSDTDPDEGIRLPSSRVRSGARRPNAPFTDPYDVAEDSELTPNPQAGEDDDDVDNMLAQSDFDEALRRGNFTALDRARRRAVTRERASRRRAQWHLQSNIEDERPSSSAALLSELNQLRDDFLNSPDPNVPPLQPVEPPIRPEPIPRPAGATSTGSVDPGPPPPAPPALIDSLSAVNPAQLSPESDLMEPSAFFSTNRQGRFRCALGASSPRFVLRSHNATITQDHPNLLQTTQPTQAAGVQSVPTTFSAKYSVGRISIKFDPPLASRYILLKLWKSGRAKGDGDGREFVELQQVCVEGWCGPRWFPAIEMA